MFISESKIVIKTCGTTTLLPAVPLIIQLVAEKCGITHVDDLFYSRKNFLQPSEQLFPHGSFDDEVAYLRSVFGKCVYIYICPTRELKND